MQNSESHNISGPEKDAYFSSLLKALDVLVKAMEGTNFSYQQEQLRRFGEENKWNWLRLPRENVYPPMAQLVKRVQQEYLWFHSIDASSNPEQNRAYFDTVGVSAASGLPWYASFAELHRLKREAPALLRQLPEYAQLAGRLHTLIMEDHVAESDVQTKGWGFIEDAFRRSFLEQIQDAELLGWQLSRHSMPPVARKRLSVGAEELWNIAYIDYFASSSLFHVYAVDIWQDITGEPHMTQQNGTGAVSDELTAKLHFGEDTPAWYVLRVIDNNFSNLHPVHVSRGIVGPFENKYITNKTENSPLPVTSSLLMNDGNAMLLRFSRQYSLAPNHEEVRGVLTQIVHQQDWRDEFIVCPAQYSKTVADSVLGTSVRVLEM